MIKSHEVLTRSVATNKIESLGKFPSFYNALEFVRVFDFEADELSYIGVKNKFYASLRQAHFDGSMFVVIVASIKE